MNIINVRKEDKGFIWNRVLSMSPIRLYVMTFCIAEVALLDMNCKNFPCHISGFMVNYLHKSRFSTIFTHFYISPYLRSI